MDLQAKIIRTILTNNQVDNAKKKDLMDVIINK